MELGDLGVLGMLIPPEYGGSGPRHVSLGVAASLIVLRIVFWIR